MSAQVGKLIADNIYVHTSARNHIAAALSELVNAALSLAPEAAGTANVFKVDQKSRIVSALHYPGFFDQAFPELNQSWRVHLDSARTTYRNYEESLNPPILHRKELLLPPDHPERTKFAQLSKQAEQIGLFSDAHLIGFKRLWEEKVRQAGYRLIDHTFQPLGNDLGIGDSTAEVHETSIQRHRTALSRSGLSAPMQALDRHGMLDSSYTYFDYGCGRGDDLIALQQSGLDARGWDPHYASDQAKCSADIVNIGFVINVIEDFEERLGALRGAFALTKKLLVVSTMLYGGSPPPGLPFRDGYLTQRNTFQKYFTQAELKEFVETVLDTEAIPVAPGIVFVFSDKQSEQRFLFGRQRNHHALRLLGYRRERQVPTPRPPRETRTQKLLITHGALVDEIWNCMLALGRTPVEGEFAHTNESILAFGSWGRALRFVASIKDPSELNLSSQQHKSDLTVYLALQLFSRRKSYRQMDVELQRDIKAHFGDYQRALAVAQTQLLDVADPALLDEACQVVSNKGLGYYVPSDFLQLHTSQIERLPTILRVYVGCASMLYGDLDGVDLIKIHIRSGKLTFMKFDDFEGKPLPRMLERIKVKLREQDIDFFLYGSSHIPPLLYQKSRFINEDFFRYEEQLEFDERLAALQLFDPVGYGPTEEKINFELKSRRLAIVDFTLAPSPEIPELDEPCGCHFAYRDLVECGETWERTRISNMPKQAESYNALHALTINVIDPVIDYFGMVKLTYGFASESLTKEINGRIAPAIDQHAAHEQNRLGRPVCERLGAAVDFLVEDEDMLEVAKWITKNVGFDRLYIYGPDRPLHVSYGPDMLRQVTIMRPSEKSGRRVPRTIPLDRFQDFIWPA